MSLSRILVVSRQTMRLLFSDPQPIILYLVVPILMMTIMRPAMKIVLIGQGFHGANGAEQVVPGFTVMFTFFWIRSMAEQFFQEHGWGTWERLRATEANAVEIMIGKLVPTGVLILIQHIILFAAGVLIFDLDAKGSLLTLWPVSAALMICVLSLTVALVALCRTINQVDAFGTLATMLFAALGGALVPVDSLPEAAQKISPAVPSYWPLEAARDVILKGDGLSAVAGPVAALLGFSVLFCGIAAVRFNISEPKAVEA